MAKNYSKLPGAIFLAKKNKIEPYNPDTSIYILLGHSSDQNRNNSNSESDLDIINMPTNCTYATNTQCGDNSQNGLMASCLFSEANPLLKDPLTNFNELKKYDILKSNTTTVPLVLGVHSLLAASDYMKKYVNTVYTFGLGSEMKTGLFRIGTNIATKVIDPETNKEICISTTIPDAKDYLRSDKFKQDTDNVKQKAIRELYLNLFQDSIYPTIDDIKSILPPNFPTLQAPTAPWYTHMNSYHGEFIKIINNNFKVDQSTLFKYFPGIFYNMSCRGLSANHSGKYELSLNPQDQGKKFTKGWLRRNESQAGRNEQARVSPPASNPASLAPSSGTSSPAPGTPGGGYRRKTRKSKRKYRKRTARK